MIMKMRNNPPLGMALRPANCELRPLDESGNFFRRIDEEAGTVFF